MAPFRAILRLLYIGKDLVSEALQSRQLMTWSRVALTAEIVFLRKHLAFYQERETKARRFDDDARLSLLFLSKLFDWKDALVNVKPETFIGWHKNGFRLFWRWKSRGGRPRPLRDIRRLIAEMALNNLTWGQERVADELSLKLGIMVSPSIIITGVHIAVWDQDYPWRLRKRPLFSQINRHQIAQGLRVMKKSILGGLHHEYGLEKAAA